MSISKEACRMQAVSEEYLDYISDLAQDSLFAAEVEETLCAQRVSSQYVIIYARGTGTRRETEAALSQAPYGVIPKCYGLADMESMTASGIDRMQQYPGLLLSGEGVLIGIVDTGIDYKSAVFRNADGTSRIESIWDQTIQTGKVPEGFLYGSEYTKAQIDEALISPDSYTIVPTIDENGHGTAVAAIAAGSRDEAAGFSGAAPKAAIAAVKLKGAKRYLRDYYLIREDTPAFQENDIMLGVLYLQRLSYRLRMPLVVCLALGTNMGDHAGGSPLGQILEELCRQRLRAVVCATGNEANAGHHFMGSLSEAQAYRDVEIRVGEGERGFTAELWGEAPDLFAVAVVSPSGEQLPRVPVAAGRREEYTFLFEATTVEIVYEVPEGTASDPLVFFRFQAPAAGLWRIRVYPARTAGSAYHIWLPLTAFLTSETYFLQSSPEVTLTEPSGAARPVSVGAYDAKSDSLYLPSGRGYNRKGVVKPELCAPGVEVLTAVPGRYPAADTPPFIEGDGRNVRYVRRSGTSMAAGITAGAAALLFSWAGLYRENLLLTNAEIKNILISGADRKENRIYPNPEWGYGTLDLYRSFQEMRLQ